MQIKVNNEFLEIKPPFSVLNLVQQIKGSNVNGIAIAINNTVVPRVQWDKTTLKENDSALIIQATQGG
ncbi:MAG: sulfur carrier protein ThiS [Bacteroidetes bacterium]|nr:sulfur carrier protein ThiS [Bacteroidota bacterium]